MTFLNLGTFNFNARRFCSITFKNEKSHSELKQKKQVRGQIKFVFLFHKISNLRLIVDLVVVKDFLFNEQNKSLISRHDTTFFSDSFV